MIVIASSKRERTNRAHFVAFLVALFALSAVFLWMIGPFVLSLFFGGLLALIARPVYERLKAHGVGRRTAASISTVMMLLLVLGPLAGFLFLAARQGVAVGKELGELKEFSPGMLTRTLGRLPMARAMGNPEEVNTRIKESIRSAGMAVSGALLEFAKAVPQFLLQMILALVAFFFFLLDGRAFVDFVLSRAVFEADVQDKLRRTFVDMARSTVLAGFAASAAQATVILAAYLILGVPAALVAGAGTFFLAWLPMIGSLPAAAAGVGYLYSQGEMFPMAMMIVFGVLAGVVDNLVRPLVLNGRSGLHPLIGLIAIISAIDMCGILGIFVGPLLAAVLISLLELWPEIAGRFGVEVSDGA